MKKIIEEVLKTEERIGIVLEEVRKKASEIRQSAEKDIAAQTSNARHQAQEIIQAAIENAKKEAEQIRDKKLEQAGREKEILLKNNSEAVENLIDNICKIIITTEYDREIK